MAMDCSGWLDEQILHFFSGASFASIKSNSIAKLHLAYMQTYIFLSR
jgi:hypothetical protein